VHFPELSLLVGARRGARGIPRVRVHRQRIVDETEADRAGVDKTGADVRLGDGREAAALRALEVAELGHLESGVRVAHDVAL
jgi:hypothetical protein